MTTRPGRRTPLTSGRWSGVAGTEDLALAREAVGLIEARGYHRDRDLAAALDELQG